MTSRISVHRSLPEFIPSMVRSRRYFVASRTLVIVASISSAPRNTSWPLIRTSGLQRDDAVDRMDECHCAADLVPAQRVQVGHVSEEGAHQVADERGAVFGHPDRECVGGLSAGGRVELEPASADLERVAVDEGRREYRFGRHVRGGRLDVHEGAPQLHDAPDVERMKIAPVLANVGVVGLRDRLDLRGVEPVPAADVVGMALGERDHAQRAAGRPSAKRALMPAPRSGCRC